VHVAGLTEARAWATTWTSRENGALRPARDLDVSLGWRTASNKADQPGSGGQGPLEDAAAAGGRNQVGLGAES